MMIPAFLLILSVLLHRAVAQQCSAAISEVIFTDLTSLNSAYTSDASFSGQASVNLQGTVLTTAAVASFGGFFFSATDFQATGGFSLKFSIRSNDSSQGVGDSFEAIIAASNSQSFSAPPYAEGNSAFGQAGWSRQNAFVVEFDSYDSGADEQDSSASHVAIYLAGTEICKTDTSFVFGDGSQYTVWLDYNGFATQAYVRISADGTRPTNAVLDCDVDIWNILNINTAHSVGFSAYNPSDQTGALHSLVDSISIADGYKPYDDDNCASYDRCSLRSTSALCIENIAGTTCQVVQCEPGYVWDVSGSSCCAFVEREAYVISGGIDVSTLQVGDSVACQVTRKIVAYLTDESNCS
ncbi:Concanavalin A-like lectin/glucanase [Gracilaria domingensis]|nr:Concanavalin A-like lectin/glucanase [Gracilaria domingensis]